MTIRPATSADIPSIMLLEREVATAAHWSEPQYRQAFAGDGPTRLLLAAEEVVEASPPISSSSGEETKSAYTIVLGFLVARHLAPEWELENIVVASTARRKGLGRQLLNALLSAARETNSESVFLEVRASNAAARTLYEKAEFKQAGRRKSYYADPVEDAVLYRLALA